MEEREAASIAVAVFVKTPGFSPIKTRLAQSIGVLAARRCFYLSLICVRRAVKAASRDGLIDPWWAVAEPSALGLWRGWPTIPQFGDDLGARMRYVYQALRRRYRGVILLGADVPTIAKEHLQAAAAGLGNGPMRVIARASDGGFGLFGANIDLSQAPWSAVPYAQSDTAQLFVDSVAPETPLIELASVHDLDTHDDLDVVANDKRVARSARRRFAALRGCDQVAKDK